MIKFPVCTLHTTHTHTLDQLKIHYVRERVCAFVYIEHKCTSEMFTASAMKMPTKPLYDRGRDRKRIAYNEKTTDVNGIASSRYITGNRHKYKRKRIYASRNNVSDDRDGGHVIMAGDDGDDGNNAKI